MPKLDARAAAEFASTLLSASGMPAEHAAAVADNLVEAELVGHRTHGLAMAPLYAQRVADGRIARSGQIAVVRDTPASFVWDAQRLAGAWVMRQTIRELHRRIESHPVVTASVFNCPHVGALQTYIAAASSGRYVALLMASDPGVVSVAPHGGIDPVITTNPIACAIPTSGAPILIDQCTSVLSNMGIREAAAGGRKLPDKLVIDAEGQPTDDPKAVFEGNGTIMPLGGELFGYKGFALGIMVEAFALALSGFARGSMDKPGLQGIFLQLIDPGAFSGREAFLAETDAFVARFRRSRPAKGRPVPRLPGERALELKQRQLTDGLELTDTVAKALTDAAAKAGVAPPAFAAS